jgi:hypothetical protein
MKTAIDEKTIKIWFQGISTSRNINHVIEIEHVGNMMKLTTIANEIIMINFNNVNLIEQL